MRFSAITTLLIGNFIFSVLSVSIAQVPDIVNINKTSGTYHESVVITGSGFNDTEANNVVFFGAMKGTVVNATTNTIEVLAPAGATFDFITVTNTASGMTGYSNEFFTPAFNGGTFSDANFQEKHNIPEQSGLYDLATCDFNGDGLNDVVTTSLSSNELILHRNVTGASEVDIQFAAGKSITLETLPRNITCGDVTGDGKPDIVVGKGGETADKVFILRNTTSSPTDITFATSVQIPIKKENDPSSRSARTLKINDLDKDGRPDIILTDQGLGYLLVFPNKSTGGTINFPKEERIDILTNDRALLGLDIGDVNGDGKSDITCNSEGRIYVFPNNSIPGSIRIGSPTTINFQNVSLQNLVLADLDLDGDNDISVTNFDSNLIYMLKNISSGSNIQFEDAKIVETGRKPWGLDIGDLNGDGLPDVVVTSTVTADDIAVLINNSTTTNLVFYTNYVGENVTSYYINSADYNGDGKPDIAYTDRSENGNENLRFVRNKQCVQAQIYPEDPAPICSSTPVALWGTRAPKVQYTWNVGGANQTPTSNYNYSAATEANYTVTISSAADNCTSTSPVVFIEDAGDNLPPTVTITGPDYVCENDPFNLEAGEVAGVSYLWTTPSGTTINSRTLSVASASDADAGIYQLQLSQSGCILEQTKLLNVSSIPDMTVSTSQGEFFCTSENRLSVPYLEGATYSWQFNGVPLSGEKDNFYVSNISGEYQASIVDANGCTATSNALTISKVSPPIASFADVASSCLDEEVVFQNTSQIAPSSTAQYLWFFGDEYFSSEENPTHTYLAEGDYIVTLSVSYQNAATCYSEYTRTINVSEGIYLRIFADGHTIQGGQQNLCAGNEMVLSVSADPGTIEWNTGSTDPTITISTPGNYSVESLGGGCKTYDLVNITEVDNVEVQAAITSHRINTGESAQLGVTGVGVDNWTWMPSESLDDATVSNPIASPSSTTVYEVTGSNVYGCSASDEITVYVGEIVLTPVEAPVAITPNGDGINDEWKIRNIEEFEACPIRIFNRKGITVYEASQYNDDWDATLNGNPLPEGAYYYILDCGESGIHSGNITVIR